MTVLLCVEIDKRRLPHSGMQNMGTKFGHVIYPARLSCWIYCDTL